MGIGVRDDGTTQLTPLTVQIYLRDGCDASVAHVPRKLIDRDVLCAATDNKRGALGVLQRLNALNSHVNCGHVDIARASVACIVCHKALEPADTCAGEILAHIHHKIVGRHRCG